MRRGEVTSYTGGEGMREELVRNLRGRVKKECSLVMWDDGVVGKNSYICQSMAHAPERVCSGDLLEYGK